MTTVDVDNEPQHAQLAQAIKDAERFKRERDHYQSHREELMEMAKRNAAVEIAQLQADLEQSRAQEKQTAAVLDGFLGDIEKAKNVGTVGVDVHALCRAQRDLLREVAQLTCLREVVAFRNECSRDGQPEEGWCVVCRAKLMQSP